MFLWLSRIISYEEYHRETDVYVAAQCQTLSCLETLVFTWRDTFRA